MSEAGTHPIGCPECRGSTHVIDTRPYPDRVRRRRECLVCEHRFTTEERRVDDEVETSDTTALLVRLLQGRDRMGRVKYGTTLDRTDLSPEQWLQHLTEELLDGAGYAQSLLREIGTLRKLAGLIQGVVP